MRKLKKFSKLTLVLLFTVFAVISTQAQVASRIINTQSAPLDTFPTNFVWVDNSPGAMNRLWVAKMDSLKVSWTRVTGRPTLATVATSGDYNDLLNLPSIPAGQVNSDWNSGSGLSQILNKPTLANVATSGAYSDLSGLPSIPAAQVNSDWNSVSGLSQILNKPTIPTNTNQLTNGAGFITGINSGNVTTALGYTPTNPNGTTAQYIRGNGSFATFPTTVSTFTNDAGYLTGITSGQVNTALGFTPVTNARTLTINGTAQDLSADRTWTITNITGNSGTATVLQTARNINGQSFNGSANITIPGSAITSIPNASLTNSSITINGSSVALGASTTVTASPVIGAPNVNNTITSGTAFQPRSGGPCHVLISTTLGAGIVGLRGTSVIAVSSTQLGTYTDIGPGTSFAITILSVADNRDGILIPVPTGWWVRVTNTAVGVGATLTSTYTRWDL